MQRATIPDHPFDQSTSGNAERSVAAGTATPRAGRVLFIGFDYHDYARAIHREFGALGFASVFHSIQPGPLHFKIARRLTASGYQSLLNRYHRDLILAVPPGTIDEVVFLQVHQVSHENLQLLRSRQPNANFTLYNWDAVTTHDYRDRLRYFDRAFTFDPEDAQTLGIGHLPLFCVRALQAVPNDEVDPLSVYFIGNIVNPHRYRVVSAFRDYCASEGIAFRTHLSTTVHGFTEMLKAGILPADVTFREIPTAEFHGILRQSSAVFDFANHRQAGFTMRVMENLCAGRKIITNNPQVKDMEFYSEDRFFVYECLDFSGVKAFLSNPLVDPSRRFSDYHIQAFARTLLGLDPCRADGQAVADAGAGD